MLRGKVNGSTVLAVLFVIFMAGCNCDRFNPQAVTPTNAAGPPTVISTKSCQRRYLRAQQQHQCLV